MQLAKREFGARFARQQPMAAHVSDCAGLDAGNEGTVRTLSQPAVWACMSIASILPRKRRGSMLWIRPHDLAVDPHRIDEVND